MIKSFNFLIAHIKKLKYLRYLQGGYFTLTICSYFTRMVIVVTLTSQKNIFRTPQKAPPKTHHKKPLKPPQNFRPKPSHITHKYHKHPYHKTHNIQKTPTTKLPTDSLQNTL